MAFFKRRPRPAVDQTAAERKAQRLADRAAWREARDAAGPLPNTVLDIIETASVLLRSAVEGEGESEAPRIVVQLAGRNPFKWSGDQPSQAIARCFPELSDTHARMALSRLSSVVSARSIIQTRINPSAPKRWIDGC